MDIKDKIVSGVGEEVPGTCSSFLSIDADIPRLPLRARRPPVSYTEQNDLICS